MKAINRAQVNSIEEFTLEYFDRICTYIHQLQEEVAESYLVGASKVELILRLQRQITLLDKEMIKCSKAIIPLD